MEAPTAIASIGELLSWLGFGLAVPLLIVTMVIRLVDGRWMPTDIVLGHDGRTARWLVGDRTYSRPLHDHELARFTDDVHPAYTSRNRPSSMRFEPYRSEARTLLIVGIVLTVVGLVGTALSLLPLVT